MSKSFTCDYADCGADHGGHTQTAEYHQLDATRLGHYLDGWVEVSWSDGGSGRAFGYGPYQYCSLKHAEEDRADWAEAMERAEKPHAYVDDGGYCEVCGQEEDTRLHRKPKA